jgi:hypothetical protein
MKKQSDIKVEERDLSNLGYNAPNNSKIYISFGSQQGVGSPNECYTTYKAANELVDFIIENNLIQSKSKIWFPFDCEDSNIYLAFKDAGFQKLVFTHFENGGNFFDINIECDFIISNPPFSRTKIGDKSYGRTDLFNRLFFLNKPFIMLQPVQMLNNSTIIKHLTKYSNDIGFICPENRMGFIINGIEKNSPAFFSFWFTWKMKLPKMWNNIK